MEKTNIITFMTENDEDNFVIPDTGLILDLVPHYDNRHVLTSIEIIFEKTHYKQYHICYQYSFAVKLKNGQSFRFESEKIKDISEDKTFNEQFAQFIENYHAGKYEPNRIALTDEVEFMDI